MVEDAELLRRYVEDGSEESFAELVHRHLGLVYFGALRRTAGDPELAADVSQSVFIRLARHARSLRNHPVLTGWLFTTTRNVAINARIAEERRRTREQEAFTMHEPPTEQNQSPDWARLHPMLFDALDALPDEDRAAVLLRFFAGHPFAEVGRVLRITEEAARKRVERALDKMHAVLAHRGVSSTSAALGIALANQASATAPAGLATSVTGAALASAAAGGGVVASIFTFMSTSKIIGAVGVGIVLGASLVGNAYLLFRTPISDGSARASSVGAPTMAPPAPTGLPHALVKNADLAALRDQMRAAGANEASIRAVIEGILRRRYREKLSDDRAERLRRGWWRDRQRTWGTAADFQRLIDDPTLIREMVTKPLEQLLGPDPLDVKEADAKYAFLPADLRQELGRLDRETPTGWSPTGQADVDAQLRVDFDAQQRVADETRKKLIASLTPEQRTDYDMRFGSFATGLMQQLESVAVTEQEFRAVFPIADAYAKELAALPSTDTRRGPMRSALDQQTVEQLIATLGYDRALDYIWSGSRDYPAYARVAREANLPPTTAGGVVQLAAETADQAAAIHADTTLTVEQKRAALLMLQQTVQPHLDALLPPAAQQQLAAAALGWLTALGDGRYKPVGTVLPGQVHTSVMTLPISVADPVPPFRFSAHLVPPRPPKD